MATPDLPPRLPGHAIIYKLPEQEKAPLSRAARYVPFLRQRQPNKAELNAAILAHEDEKIDPVELEKAALFEFGEGFPSHPPAEYRPGAEPPYAPMSREQMRLLLVKVLPPDLVPFALERMTFNYEPVPDQNETPPGPTAKLKDGKIHLTFYRNNFITSGPPPGRAHDRDQRQRRRLTAGFVDPQKIAIFLGQTIAKLMPPPDSWTADTKAINKRYREQVNKLQRMKNPYFKVTESLVNKKTVPDLTKDQKAVLRRQKQWEDFVALSIVNPDMAKQTSPETYEYVKKSFDSFNDVATDKAALERFKEQAGPDGTIQLTDFRYAQDLRAEDEKLADQPLKPDTTRFDEVATGVNRFLGLFGQRLRYTMPEDPDRARLMAKSDEQVKQLMELEQPERDFEFGQILMESKDFDMKDRYKALNYLFATSQAGELADWRVYAWLHRFSSTFRATNGRRISENDYKDLAIVYDQSEKAGRLGSGVMPFKRLILRPPAHMEARFHGRPLSVYVAVEQEKRLADIQKKIAGKNPSAIFEAIPTVIKQFEAGLPFHATYDGSPEGLISQNGSLAEYLGDDLGQEIGNLLASKKVSKITPDAQFLATAYFDEYKKIGRHYQEKLNRNHYEILSNYAADLNRPPEQEIKSLLKTKAKAVAENPDPAYIAERIKAAGDAYENLKATLGVELSQRSSLSPDIQAHLIDEIDKHGITDPGLLLIRLAGPNGPIDRLFGLKTEAGQQERRNLINTLFSPNMRESLQLMHDVQVYQREARPTYIENIEAATEFLASDKVKTILPESIKAEDLAPYQELGIRFDSSDQKAIDESVANVDMSGLLEPDKNDPTKFTEESQALANSLLAEHTESAKNKKRAEILRQKIQEAPEEVRSNIIVKMVGTAIDKLDSDYFNAVMKKPMTYEQRYQLWLKGDGKIMQADPLKKLGADLGKASRLMDQSIREGLQLKHETIERITRSLHYEKELAKASKTTKKPSDEKSEG